MMLLLFSEKGTYSEGMKELIASEKLSGHCNQSQTFVLETYWRLVSELQVTVC